MIRVDLCSVRKLGLNVHPMMYQPWPSQEKRNHFNYFNRDNPISEINRLNRYWRTEKGRQTELWGNTQIIIVGSSYHLRAGRSKGRNSKLPEPRNSEEEPTGLGPRPLRRCCPAGAGTLESWDTLPFQWLLQNQTNKYELLLSVKYHYRPWSTLHRCQINNDSQNKSHGLDLNTGGTFPPFILVLKLPRIITLIRSRHRPLSHTIAFLSNCLYQLKLAYLKSVQNKPREIKQSETLTSFLWFLYSLNKIGKNNVI